VATELAATQPLPFSLRVPDEATTGILNGALYKLQGSTPPSRKAIVRCRQRSCGGPDLATAIRRAVGMQSSQVGCSRLVAG
jgi:hypothetical protein